MLLLRDKEPYMKRVTRLLLDHMVRGSLSEVPEAETLMTRGSQPVGICGQLTQRSSGWEQT